MEIFSNMIKCNNSYQDYRVWVIPPSAKLLRVRKILLPIRGFNLLPSKILESSHLVTMNVGCKPIRAHSPSKQPTRLKGCGRGLHIYNPHIKATETPLYLGVGYIGANIESDFKGGRLGSLKMTHPFAPIWTPLLTEQYLFRQSWTWCYSCFWLQFKDLWSNYYHHHEKMSLRAATMS